MSAIFRKVEGFLTPYPNVTRIAKQAYFGGLDLYRRLVARNVPMEKLLLGGENGISAGKYSRLTEHLARASTPLSMSPHVKLLEQYREIGDDLFLPGTLEKTGYYKNAAQAIDLCGYYFGATDRSMIADIARGFASRLQGDSAGPSSPGRSRTSSPVLLRKIRNSGGSYEIIDGHHRLALAYVRGVNIHKAFIERGKGTTTPIQDLLDDCLWTRGEPIRFQPLDYPELQSWRVVRRCSDLFQLMEAWLEAQSMPDDGSTYLDVGCSYGWFVHRMSELGFDAKGVDGDTAALNVGRVAYGLSPEQVIATGVQKHCRQSKEAFDVVSSFSLDHHFAQGKAALTADDYFAGIARITRKYFFFDIDQSHERWFGMSASDWNDEPMIRWIKANTSFKSVTRLGHDRVGSPHATTNLFVCET